MDPDNPRILPQPPNANRQYKVFGLVDRGWFFRAIQNITVEHTLSLLDSQGSIRIYGNQIICSHSATFRDMTEVGVLGMYSGGYPRLRKLTLGLNITF